MADRTDESIIRMLRKDSRASNVDIAREVGLSEGAVRHRIERLCRSGAITRFTIETGSESGIFAIVMVKSKHDTKKMMADVSALGLASEAYEIAGDYDGCVILEGVSVEDIDRRIDAIRKVRGVADTRTYISFKKYRLGVPAASRH